MDVGQSVSFCACGIQPVEDPWDDEPCATCAASPHHRHCGCRKCGFYWDAVEARGIKLPPRVFDSAEGMMTPLTRAEVAEGSEAIARRAREAQ